MSHTERFVTRHPLCTCPEQDLSFFAKAVDSSQCAGGTIAHPVIDAATLADLIERFKATAKRPDRWLLVCTDPPIAASREVLDGIAPGYAGLFPALASCPNEPACAHLGVEHDIYELGDPWPTCTIEGCRCGHPGTASVYRAEDGTRTVADADPVILVARELLDNAEPGVWDPDAEVLTLDSAGEYRYRYLRPGQQPDQLVFGRLAAG